uniref:RICIN domain-containing protein n=1 Tax=Paenarthrobacter nicotinovorans TaxID=29320 RepID=UPI003F493A98
MLRSLRRRLIAALIVAVAALAIIPTQGISPASAIGEPGFTNPLVQDAADPTIEFHDGNYYMVATTWDNHVVMRKAPTLAGLSTAKPVTVYSDTNPGRNANMWAPELQRLNGPNGWRWYLMYTMGQAGNFGNQHLQVIESAGDDPMGPYSYKGRPIPTDEWNIDASYLELNGELFVTWSQFAPDGMQSNYIARMTTPWSATGPLNILSQPTEPWERIGMPVNEGPVPLQKNGKTWIVYSASFCGTEDYQLATLEYTGGDPVLATSWTKSDGPVFSKANGVFGPGHNDFFDSPDGTETWNLYHANARADGGCARERSARAQQVTWSAENEPIFGQPLATTTQITVPSGERGPITAKVEGANWQMVSRSSGLCAVVAPSQAGDGPGLVQGACSSPRANWKLDPTGDGFLRIVNASSGKSLGPASCGTADGTAIQQASWMSLTCQQWTVAASTEGWSSVTNRASGRLLDLTGCSAATGAVIAQGTARGTACQDWSLRPAGAVAVTSVASGKAFDLPACSTADGAVLQQWEWSGSPCQRVTFTGTSDGRTEIHPFSAPEKCLSVTNGSTADGATVSQGACGVTGSRWRVAPGNDGTVEFRAAHSGKALDLSFCSATNGSGIGQWTVLNNDCQRFRLSAAGVEPATPLRLEPTVGTRCLGGKAYVSVAVKNVDDLPADVTVTTGYGSKTFTKVAAGSTASAAFTARQSAVPAGQVTVAGTGSDDTDRTTEGNSAYAAASC